MKRNTTPNKESKQSAQQSEQNVRDSQSRFEKGLSVKGGHGFKSGLEDKVASRNSRK